MSPAAPKYSRPAIVDDFGGGGGVGGRGAGGEVSACGQKVGPAIVDDFGGGGGSGGGWGWGEASACGQKVRVQLSLMILVGEGGGNIYYVSGPFTQQFTLAILSTDETHI